MPNRKKYIREQKKRGAGRGLMAAVLVATLSLGPIVLPASSVQAAAVVQTVDSVTGFPGQTVVLDLANDFGAVASNGSVLTDFGSAPDIVQSEQIGSKLYLYFNRPGATSLTVTLNQTSRQFGIRVVDPGTDGRLDIGDVVQYMRSYPGAAESGADVSGLLAKIGSTAVKENHAPTPVKFREEIAYSAGLAVSLNDLFHDADGDSLQYSAAPVEANGLDAAVGGGSLAFREGSVNPNASVFLITAVDRAGAAAHMLLRVLKGNHAPTVTNAAYVTNNVYSPVGLTPAPIPLSGMFYDPDGDAISYGVTPEYSNGVSASVYGKARLLSAVP
ncbi:hypothetical protein LJK88_38580 [Paenibacillus sp. P26]|nr:hypothetical protein LJK88_38580 [Paenibacillus sp. P26]